MSWELEILWLASSLRCLRNVRGSPCVWCIDSPPPPSPHTPTSTFVYPFKHCPQTLTINAWSQTTSSQSSLYSTSIYCTCSHVRMYVCPEMGTQEHTTKCIHFSFLTPCPVRILSVTTALATDWMWLGQDLVVVYPFPAMTLAQHG